MIEYPFSNWWAPNSPAVLGNSISEKEKPCAGRNHTVLNGCSQSKQNQEEEETQIHTVSQYPFSFLLFLVFLFCVLSTFIHSFTNDSLSSSYVPGTKSGIQGSEESKGLGLNPKDWKYNMLPLPTFFRRICVLRDLRERATLNPKVITSLIDNFQIFLFIGERGNTLTNKNLSISP